MKWIKDEEFIRGTIPMTKFDTRILTIGLLEIAQGDIFLDIGGGTGSISIEASLQGAKTYVIEREEEGIKLITSNAKKFNIDDIEIIKDFAPGGMENIKTFNKCFIGGSGRNLVNIMEAVTEKLSSGGIVVANFITLNNLNSFQNLLKQYEYTGVETKLIQVSQIDARTGMMLAQNPIFMVKGIKQ